VFPGTAEKRDIEYSCTPDHRIRIMDGGGLHVARTSLQWQRRCSTDEPETALDEERARSRPSIGKSISGIARLPKMRYSGSEDAEALRLSAEIRALQASTSWAHYRPSAQHQDEIPFLAPRTPASAHSIGDNSSSSRITGDARSARPAKDGPAARFLVVDVRIPAPDIQSSGVRMTAIVRSSPGVRIRRHVHFQSRSLRTTMGLRQCRGPAARAGREAPRAGSFRDLWLRRPRSNI